MSRGKYTASAAGLFQLYGKPAQETYNIGSWTMAHALTILGGPRAPLGDRDFLCPFNKDPIMAEPSAGTTEHPIMINFVLKRQLD